MVICLETADYFHTVPNSTERVTIMKIEGLKIELAPIMIGTSSALFTDETTPWIHADLTQAEQYIFHICKFLNL